MQIYEGLARMAFLSGAALAALGGLAGVPYAWLALPLGLPLSLARRDVPAPDDFDWPVAAADLMLLLSGASASLWLLCVSSVLGGWTEPAGLTALFALPVLGGAARLQGHRLRAGTGAPEQVVALGALGLFGLGMASGVVGMIVGQVQDVLAGAVLPMVGLISSAIFSPLLGLAGWCFQLSIGPTDPEISVSAAGKQVGLALALVLAFWALLIPALGAHLTHAPLTAGALLVLLMSLWLISYVGPQAFGSAFSIGAQLLGGLLIGWWAHGVREPTGTIELDVILGKISSMLLFPFLLVLQLASPLLRDGWQRGQLEAWVTSPILVLGIGLLYFGFQSMSGKDGAHPRR